MKRNLTVKILMLLSCTVFQFFDGSVKDSSLPKSPQRLNPCCRAPFVLWAGIDEEETKKQVGLLQPNSLFCLHFRSERY